MAEDKPKDGSDSRAKIIELMNTPALRFLALALLIGEAGLLAFSVTAGGVERAVGIAGSIAFLFACIFVFLRIASHPGVLNQGAAAPAISLDSLSFDQISSDIENTIKKLEKDDFNIAKRYRDNGQGQRIADGLYSGILYASAAVPTGHVEAIFYGNLMEWDGCSLGPRYFKGPYNDELIGRTLQLDGMKISVAGEAFCKKEIQMRNIMENELMSPGESRLKGMISIPVACTGGTRTEKGDIAVINIDSAGPKSFPELRDPKWNALEMRARQLATLLNRVNNLRGSLGIK